MIGIIDFTESELKDLDKEIRTILRNSKMHFKMSNKARLYLNRKENGRGLKNCEWKNESILNNLFDYIKDYNDDNCVKSVITHAEMIKNTNLINIKKKLRTKYEFGDEGVINNEHLKKKQKSELIKWIGTTTNYNKLFYYRGDEIMKKR
jgi:hypothetical protein